jgi:hypothetical protein
MLKFCFAGNRAAGPVARALIFACLLLCGARQGSAQLNVGGLLGGSVGFQKDAGFVELPYTYTYSYAYRSYSYSYYNYLYLENTNSALTYGLDVSYRWHGLNVGVLAQQVKTPLTDSGSPVGDLKMNTTLLTFGYQGRPARGKGHAWHYIAGVDFARTTIVPKTGTYTSTSMVVKSTDPSAKMLGLGLDYFLSRNVSLTIFDVRGYWTTPVTAWGSSGQTLDPAYPISGANVQFVTGLRFWIH